MKVLIVEDNPETASALCKLLTTRLKGTVECIMAHTLEEALNKAISFEADITILDLMLPGSSVDEVIESIPKFPPPVIVVTELDDPDRDIEFKCWTNDAQNFFRKSDLRATIVSKEGAELVTAIMKAHWRRTLPSLRAKQVHADAEMLHDATRRV